MEWYPWIFHVLAIVQTILSARMKLQMPVDDVMWCDVVGVGSSGMEWNGMRWGEVRWNVMWCDWLQKFGLPIIVIYPFELIFSQQKQDVGGWKSGHFSPNFWKLPVNDSKIDEYLISSVDLDKNLPWRRLVPIVFADSKGNYFEMGARRNSNKIERGIVWKNKQGRTVLDSTGWLKTQVASYKKR